MSFGERLKKLREEKGITQRGLGHIVYIFEGRISKIESGERIPTIIEINHIARYFKVKPSWLAFGDKEEDI